MYVKVDLLNISFTRANDHHYERYLTSDDSFTHKPEKNLEITKAPEANDTNVIVYTHRIISAYFKQLLSLDEQLFNVIIVGRVVNNFFFIPPNCFIKLT